MATQYNTDLPFSSTHPQQAFKLFELPNELLALLESENPPTFTITSTPSTSTVPGYALLSPSSQPTKQYQLRQKSTSNPLLVLAPSTTSPTEADDPDTFIPQPSITTIAKDKDTIELILQEEQAKAVPKVNKWHEKFAASRLKK